MKTHILISILIAALLFGGSSLLQPAANAEDCSACPKKPDATAVLRQIELKVAKRQYEKTLTELSDAEISLQEGPSETLGSPQEASVWGEKQKLRIQVLERVAAKLRDRIQGNIAETNKLSAESDASKQKAAKREVTSKTSSSLQGKWEGVEAGLEAEGACSIEITGHTIHFRKSNTNEWYKATFTLIEGNPGQIHATITDCPAPDFVGKSSVAIYKLEYGKLTLAGNKPGSSELPKGFERDPDSRIFIFKKAP